MGDQLVEPRWTGRVGGVLFTFRIGRSNLPPAPPQRSPPRAEAKPTGRSGPSPPRNSVEQLAEQGGWKRPVLPPKRVEQLPGERTYPVRSARPLRPVNLGPAAGPRPRRPRPPQNVPPVPVFPLGNCCPFKATGRLRANDWLTRERGRRRPGPTRPTYPDDLFRQGHRPACLTNRLSAAAALACLLAPRRARRPTGLPWRALFPPTAPTNWPNCRPCPSLDLAALLAPSPPVPPGPTDQLADDETDPSALPSTGRSTGRPPGPHPVPASDLSTNWLRVDRTYLPLPYTGPPGKSRPPAAANWLDDAPPSRPRP